MPNKENTPRFYGHYEGKLKMNMKIHKHTAKEKVAFTHLGMVYLA